MPSAATVSAKHFPCFDLFSCHLMFSTIFTKESDGRQGGGDLSARILAAEESKDAAIILTPIDVTDLSKIVLPDAIILHSISSCTVMDFFSFVLSFFSQYFSRSYHSKFNRNWTIPASRCYRFDFGSAKWLYFILMIVVNNTLIPSLLNSVIISITTHSLACNCYENYEAEWFWKNIRNIQIIIGKLTAFSVAFVAASTM